MAVAAAATATGSAAGAAAAALVGEMPTGFFFNPAAEAGDALVIGSLALSFNGDGDAAEAFSGDDLRCAAAAAPVLLAESSERRTVLVALVGAECVNLGAGRAVKVFVMVVDVVVVVVVWLPDPLLLPVADLMRKLLPVADELLAVLATPLASGLLGLRVPARDPAVAVAGLRNVDPNVVRGEGTFGLAAALLPVADVVVADLLAVTCRRGFTCEAPVAPAAAVPLLLVVVAVLRIAEVVVVVVRAVLVAVLDLLAATLLANGAVAGRVPAVLPVVVLGAGLAAALLEANGLRATVLWLLVLAAPVAAVVVDVVEAVVLAAGAVRGRAAAAVPAGLAPAVLPTVVFLIGPPAAAAAVGLALAADVAVVDAVLAMGFFAASPGEVFTLGLDVAVVVAATAATAAAAATAVAAAAATATSATGAFSSCFSSSLGFSSAVSLGFSWETASSVICSLSFSAKGSAAIGSTTAIVGSSSRAGSGVSLLLVSPFV